MKLPNLKLISLDFYKEISLYELRVLYLNSEYQLKRLDKGLEIKSDYPLEYMEMRTFLEERKIAIESEIKLRLKKMTVDGNLMLSFKNPSPLNADLMTQLEEAIKLDGNLANFKVLKGLCTYDIKYNPNYANCLRMKDKLNELRDIVKQ